MSDRRRANGVNPGKTGAIVELAVAVDLLRRGFDVFRALSPSCSCDLVALKPGLVLRIEVRTMIYYEKGQRCYATAPKDTSKFDVLAAWDPIKETIQYIPSLLTWEAADATAGA